MINWLKELFHIHKWVIIKQGNLIRDGNVVGCYYDCRCSFCGKIKTFTS